MNAKSLLGLLAVVSLGVLFWWGIKTKDAREELPSALAGKSAPVFEMELLDSFKAEWGEKLNLADYLGKKPIILNFWASWCYPACYQEAPILEAGWRRWRDKVMFIAVDTQDEKDKGEEFVSRFGFTFPVVYDPRGSIGIDYGMYGVPETFAITRKGRVVERHAGSLDEAMLTKMVQEVLK